MNSTNSNIKMKRLRFDEVKKLELDILKYFASFCEKNGIQYWLDYGTLIGCIRHKGFIPWDDDIDVGMKREDYDRFVKLFNEDQQRFQFHSLETDGFKFVIGKCGEIWDTHTILINKRRQGSESRECIKIDVFPYDCIPENIDEFNFMKKKERIAFAIAALQNHRQEPKGTKFRRIAIKIVRFLSKFLPHDYYEKARAIHRKYEGMNTTKYYCFADPYDCIMEGKWVSEFLRMEFEGYEFCIPKDYDHWLKQIYGEYMKLPPVEKQVPHHNYDEAYYLNYDI